MWRQLEAVSEASWFKKKSVCVNNFRRGASYVLPHILIFFFKKKDLHRFTMCLLGMKKIQNLETFVAEERETLGICLKSDKILSTELILS